MLGQYGRSKKCQLRGTTDDEQEYIVSLWPTSLDPTETVFAVVTDGSTEARRWAVEARKVRDSEDHATDLEAFKTKVENADVRTLILNDRQVLYCVSDKDDFFEDAEEQPRGDAPGHALIGRVAVISVADKADPECQSMLMVNAKVRSISQVSHVSERASVRHEGSYRRPMSSQTRRACARPRIGSFDPRRQDRGYTQVSHARERASGHNNSAVSHATSVHA